MTTAASDRTEAGLAALLSRTLLLAREIADDANVWTNLPPASKAGQELSAQERREDRPTKSWPWLSALMIARWGLQVAIEIAENFGTLVVLGGTSYGADVLCRAILEHASLTFWLLDADIDDDERLARVLVYRLHSAGETERAVEYLDLAEHEDRSRYGELPDEVTGQIMDLGWTFTRRRRVSYDGKTVAWPSYSERVAQLVRHIWPQHKLPYATLSAVGHAELLGLTRNLAAPRDGHDLRPDPSGSAMWLWHNTYLVLGALVFATERAAGFLGRTNHVAALRSWMVVLDHALPARRPTAP